VYLLDGLLAAVLAVASVDGLANLGSEVAGWWVLCVFPVAALLLRHRWPIPALILAGAGAVIHWLGFREAGAFPQPIDLAGLIVLFSVASLARSRRLSAAVCVLVMVAVYGAAVLNGSAFADPAGAGFWARNRPSNALIVGLLCIAVAFVLGDGVRSHRNHLRTLEQRAADLEREQQQRAQLSAAAERARIARDLHDIVAHRVTAMVIQAGAAKAILAGQPEPAVHALEAVEAGGRAAMIELRSLLGMLTPTGRDAPLDVLDDAPAPCASDATNGRGLVGMRERVATYAGTLRAGPEPDGRWRVRATLPIPPTSQPLESQ
jgi:signal transduction histidine kinase